ncbi:antibiotic biosynthesis monooxygenase [Kitasatospora sp. NBC_00070]|uniref:putative quinol monooxygenase n=1 Tax=Kitasatospora sp. NBC_00070 TaxID=2975962 RepID=UPI00324A4CDF
MLTVLVGYEAAPGRQDELRTELEAQLEPAAELPGCLAFELYIDPNCRDRMLTVEQWTSLAGWRRHRPTRLGQLAELLARPATVRCLTVS